jgi:arginyl-tRNA synthetase
MPRKSPYSINLYDTGKSQLDSRLVLCNLTARVLKQGLDVLGIETLEQM